jgi:hypothetical protein
MQGLSQFGQLSLLSFADQHKLECAADYCGFIDRPAGRAEQELYQEEYSAWLDSLDQCQPPVFTDEDIPF